jgi:hypothetical protein
MSKLNTKTTRPAGAGPVTGPAVSTVRTYEGGPGWARDPKGELFLLAVANFAEDTFYEARTERDARFAALVHTVAVADPAWLGDMLAWLRQDVGMRTAPIAGAAEAVRALVDARKPGGRQIVASVLRRPDEPGELVAYWTARYGRTLPFPLRKGIADALPRLYHQKSLLKWDTEAHAWRFGDVVELVHPAVKAPASLFDNWEPAKLEAMTEAGLAGAASYWEARQHAVYTHAIDRRHGRDGEVPEALPVIAANRALRAEVTRVRDAVPLTDPARLAAAGMTWEDALSLGGQVGADKAGLWAAMIPSMGYTALLRNLRNFDQAGVPDPVAAGVAARLADPEQVAQGRMFPMAYLAAWRAAPSLRWAWALETAIGHSLNNVPELAGRTLVLVDTSFSMNAAYSARGTVKRWDAAVAFGLAVARRCEHADVVSFSTSSRVFPTRRGESLLRSVDRWKDDGFFIGGGTYTGDALRRHFAGHDRVVILTDEQAADTVYTPAGALVYTWNLAGYQAGHTAARRGVFTLGGVSDAMFRAVPILERGRDAGWPWDLDG